MTQVNEIRLSIILPVYNVAPYLRLCLDSILHDICQDTEVIIVDDGSTDESSKICDEYKEEYSQVRVRHQENAGQSAARNAGLSAARGKYISFVDSDDFVDSSVLNYMVTALDESKVDFAVSSYLPIPFDFMQLKCSSSYSKEYHIIDVEDFLQNIKKYSMQVWNKVYRRSFIDGLKFKEGILYEDVAFIHTIAIRMSQAIYIDTPMYYYRVARPGSTVSTFKMTRLPAYDDVGEFVRNVKENYSQKSYLSILEIAANFFQQQYMECKALLGDENIMADILKRYRKYSHLLPFNFLPLYQSLFRISPNLYCFLKSKVK